MEIAAGNDGFIVREDERIVRDGVQFPLNDRFHILQGIPDRAVDLRDAAQGIRILDAVLLAVVQDLGARQELPHMLRHKHLAHLAARFMDAGVKGIPETGQRFKIHGSDDVRQFGRLPGIIECQGTHARHGAGPVGHAQAFLADQGCKGRDPGPFHGFGAREYLPFIFGFAQPQHRQRHVRERRQIAGRPQRTLLRDHRQNVFIEHFHQHLDQDGPHTGIPAAKGVGPQQHDAPGHIVRIRLARRGTVT